MVLILDVLNSDILLYSKDPILLSAGKRGGFYSNYTNEQVVLHTTFQSLTALLNVSLHVVKPTRVQSIYCHTAFGSI